MNIFKTIWQKFKNIFTKKEEIAMLNEGADNFNKESFKESLKVTFDKVLKNRKSVETHICHGDGLGIKKKLEY